MEAGWDGKSEYDRLRERAEKAEARVRELEEAMRYYEREGVLPRDGTVAPTYGELKQQLADLREKHVGALNLAMEKLRARDERVKEFEARAGLPRNLRRLIEDFRYRVGFHHVFIPSASVHPDKLICMPIHTSAADLFVEEADEYFPLPKDSQSEEP